MNKNSPKVSIILPTYNGAKYIRQSINSCLNQSYKNIELIIIDDGSKDEIPNIIRSYQDKRIKYLKHKKNKGLPHALNTGFTKATGEYLTWTSDDNYYASDAIKKMLSFLKKKKCLFVYCDNYIVNDAIPPNKQKVVRRSDVLTLKDHNDVGPCFLYSRKIKECIGNYDPDAFLAEDYDYWIRVSKKFSLCHLAEPLYYYRIRDTSLYIVRYYEVKIVSFLVKIKNNIINVDETTNLFVNLIVEKNRASMSTLQKVIFFFLGLILRKKNRLFILCTFLTKVRFSKKIGRIVRNFQTGRINFRQAKKSLIDTINITHTPFTHGPSRARARWDDLTGQSMKSSSNDQ